MTDLSKEAREELSNTALINELTLAKKVSSHDKGAEKYLFTLYDGVNIETVKINEAGRTTICVSTQAGCPLKCSFCATGMSGFKRDLSAGEILAQILYFIGEEKTVISNIVFMGMGEPLLNYANLMKAVRVINAPWGIGLGARKMTISTCGLPKQIRKLGTEGIEFNLSISLNAPNDTVRNKIMPVNRKFPLREVMNAVENYITATRRRVTFEYVLLNGINDTIKDAKELSLLLEGKLCHVNLIPYNSTGPNALKTSSRERITLFTQLLEQKGISTTVRKSKGSDIKAACGQLAGGREIKSQN